MERNIQRNGLINLLVLLVVGATGFAVARSADSLAGQVAMLFVGVGILVAAVSWFQMRLEERERLERLEVEELSKTRGDTALFQEKNAEVFPAQRSREHFQRFFVPVFTAILCLAQAFGAWLFWRSFSHLAQTPGRSSSRTRRCPCSSSSCCVGAVHARQILNDHRAARGPSVAAAGRRLPVAERVPLRPRRHGRHRRGSRRADGGFYFARFLCVLLAVVALETLAQLVLEIYRPRTKRGSPRPLFESRLVGLLGQPEGLITTASQALDYQFGFKVSETWFYRFFARAIWVLVFPANGRVAPLDLRGVSSKRASRACSNGLAVQWLIGRCSNPARTSNAPGQLTRSIVSALSRFKASPLAWIPAAPTNRRESYCGRSPTARGQTSRRQPRNYRPD